MIALIVLLCVTAVYGQGHGHPHSCIHNNHMQLKEAEVVSKVIADMDKDGDGVVAGADIANEFLTKYDHDGDGKISEDEFIKQWHQTYHDAHDFARYLFHHFDQNDDLFLTADDLLAFAKIVDTNGDNEETTAEFTAYLTKVLSYTLALPVVRAPVQSI